MNLFPRTTIKICITVGLVSISQFALSEDAIKTPGVTWFQETSGILNTEDKSRRKWDGPIIGDFDHNGYPDLVLTEHAHNVSIYWNEKGVFSAPQQIISGDLHGMSFADFNNDGVTDAIIAQGGGDGGNLRKPKQFTIQDNRIIKEGKQLIQFENSRGRSLKALDINNDGLLDLYLTGFATPQQIKTGANHLYKNTGKGEFEFVSLMPFADRLAYRSTVIDFNHDGISDILTYGGKKIVLAQGSSGFTYSDTTNIVLGDNRKIKDVSAVAQLDYDGDGDDDLVLSRAEHQFEHERYFDPETNTFAFFARFNVMNIEDLTIAGDLHIYNLQMAYPDFEVFVGENKVKWDFANVDHSNKSHDYDKAADRKIQITQEQAYGWPANMPKDKTPVKQLLKDTLPGLYIGYIGNNVWRIASLTRSPTTGVISNVLSQHSTSKDEALPVVVLRNDAGKFTDVTESVGIVINEQTTGVVSADFNNDGWEDLFFTRYGNMATENQQILYINDQGKGFTRILNHGVVSKELGASGSGAEVIDFDADGDLDIIYANERGRWHLSENVMANQLSNKFIKVKVGFSPKQRATFIGAQVQIKACGRVQQRVVGRSSSSFGVGSAQVAHFGIGDCDVVNEISVRWPNNEASNTKNISGDMVVPVGHFIDSQN